MKTRSKFFVLEIIFAYLAAGIIWILLPDQITTLLIKAPQNFPPVKLSRDWLLIIATAWILFRSLQKIYSENFSDLFESANVGIFRSLPNGRFMKVNAAMASIYGYASPNEMLNEVINISSQIYTAPENYNKFIDMLRRNGAVERFQAHNQKKDGILIWTSTNARIVKDRNGNILYYEGFVTDITEQKNLENAMREIDERHRLLVEKLPAVVFMDMFGGTQVSQYISPRIKDLLGYTPEEWNAKETIWENSLHPDDKERVLAEDTRTDRTNEPFRIEYRMRHRDGHYVWIKEDASIIKSEEGTPLFWHGILLDITEQKQAEKALQQRDAILKAVGFSAEQFLKSINWEDCVEQVLARLGETTQVSRVYIFNKQLTADHANSISQMYEWCNNDIEPQIQNEALQNMRLEENGFTRWVEHFGNGMSIYGSIKDFPADEQKILKEQGILSLICIPINIGNDWWGFIGFDECKIEREWTDIEIEALRAAANTLGKSIERKLSEESLLSSESSYRGLFNAVRDAIYIQDKNGCFLDVNEGAVQMYGYSKEFFIGKTPEFLSAPGKNDLKKTLKAIQDAFNGEPQQFEFWGVKSSGEIFPKDVRLFKGTYFGQEVIIAIAQDITARKQNEEALQKQLKELSILHLAALAESTARDTDELIQNITDIIGDTLYSDNCGVLLLNKTKDKLQPHFSYRGTTRENLSLSIPLTTGVTGKAAATGRSIRLGSVSQEPAYHEVTSGVQSELCVPIASGSKIIGVLNVESKLANAFTESDERLLNTIAGGLANAMERIQLFELEKKRRESAEIVMQAATNLINLLDLPSLHNAILEWLHKISPYDSASILEIEGEYVRVTAATGLPDPEQALNQTFPADNILCQIINETGQPLIISDCQNDPRFEHWGSSQHVRGWMGVPLISRAQVIGYLTVDSRTPNAFTQDDAIAAQTFAHQAATSLENTRLYIETKQRLDELEMVNRVSYALRAAKDTNEMLPILLNEIKASIETDEAAILLYDHETDALIPHAASGWMANLPKSTFKPGEGIIGKVYSSGAAHISPKFTNDPITHPENAEFFGEGWGGIAVPIRTASETIGVIIVAIQKPRQIETHHTRLIATLAEIAGNAVYRSSLYERSEEQIRRLTTLREVDLAITSSLDLRVTLDILAEHLTSKMGASAARILVFNFNSQMLDCCTANGFNNQSIRRTSIGIGDGLASQILLNRKDHYIKNIDKETGLKPDHLSAEGFKSYYAVPLFSKGATRGIIETYFRYPFTPTTDWKDFIKTLAGQAAIAIDNTQLFDNLQRTNQELSLAYDTTLEGWGKALELRDKETEGHTRRVTNLTLELARQMGIPASELTHIRRGALLHDIGKMGVPDNILRKPGPLTKNEMEAMRKHPQYAYDLLSPIAYLRPTLDIAYCHHEWWNGDGYPHGLKGEEIPLSARIFAVVDVWDALLSDRPYRQAWQKEDVMKYITDLSGKQFDPAIVNIFKKMIGNETNFIRSNSPENTQKAPKKEPVKPKKTAAK